MRQRWVLSTMSQSRDTETRSTTESTIVGDFRRVKQI